MTRFRVVIAVSTALGAFGTLAASSGRADAFEIFGLKIFEGKKADAEADVVGDPLRYEVTVDTDGADKALGKLVTNASSLWSDREKPASGAAGLVAKAKSDYKRILATLYGEGYYGGTIHITIGGKEAASLAPDASFAAPAQVAIRIEPGPRFLFGRVEIAGAAPPPADRRDRVDLPADQGFAPGEVARSGVILKAERLATEAWRQQGHPKAKVTDRQVVADHATNTVKVLITVDPGPKAAFGGVAVKGTERMDPAFVARQTGLMPGVEYDPDEMERARKRLARLDVFQSLKVDEEAEVGPDGQLPVTVSVQERKLRRIGLGATYSTVDGAGVNAYWLHRNLFGHAESLRFDFKVAGLGDTIDYQDFDYAAGVTYKQPGTFTPDTDLIASVLGQRQVLDSYTETSVDGRVGLAHTFTDELTGELSVDVKKAQFEDDLGTRDFLTFGLPGKLTYDTRDSTVDPTEGYFLEATAEPFYEAEYGNFAGRMTGEARGYLGFADDRFVLAGRVKVGSLVGSSIAETPPDKLFFAGGGGSIRGYAYQGIGVRGPRGVLTGGRSLFESSVELRAKVTDTIGVVAFTDVGSVGENSFVDFSGDLKVGAGAGLRYYTGLGPIRLDAAVPLNPEAGDPDFALYVGIGQAF